MKSGMSRRIDDLGRIVLPKEMRTNLGMNEGDAVEITLQGSGIYLQKLTSECAICKSRENVLQFGFDPETGTPCIWPEGLPLCRRCAALIGKGFGETAEETTDGEDGENEQYEPAES